MHADQPQPFVRLLLLASMHHSYASTWLAMQNDSPTSQDATYPAVHAFELLTRNNSQLGLFPVSSF